MARHEEEREDLMRDAKALVDRIELVVPGFEEPVVVGFRTNGAASFYFGQDAVYHFNSQLELRRALSTTRFTRRAVECSSQCIASELKIPR